MKIVADGSVDGPIVERLRLRGQKVVFVAELDPGIDDEAVLTLANQRDALLLTADKDFGGLIFRLGESASARQGESKADPSPMMGPHGEPERSPVEPGGTEPGPWGH